MIDNKVYEREDLSLPLNVIINKRGIKYHKESYKEGVIWFCKESETVESEVFVLKQLAAQEFDHLKVPRYLNDI